MAEQIDFDKITALRERLEARETIQLKEVFGATSESIRPSIEMLHRKSDHTVAGLIYMLSICGLYDNPTQTIQTMIRHTPSPRNTCYSKQQLKRLYKSEQKAYEARVRGNVLRKTEYLGCALDDFLDQHRTTGNSGGYASVNMLGEDSSPSWDDSVRTIEDSR